MNKNIAVIGSAGAIGNALIKEIAVLYPEATIYAFSRTSAIYPSEKILSCQINYDSEASIENAALTAAKEYPLDLVMVATGILHEGNLTPEKTLSHLSAEKFNLLFKVNTILPALIAKHFIPQLNKDKRSVFAALSARVGSISDNRLGGWYAYRASKAALNMIIKNAAIETARINKQAIIVGLHPGTVDSHLSKPFQKNIPNENLFTPDYSARKLLEVLNHLTVKDSGKCLAWDGNEIQP